MRRIVLDVKLSEIFVLSGAKAHHLVKVLRIRPGEQLNVVDCEAATALAEVTDVSTDTVTFRVLKTGVDSCEPHSQVSLVLALLKNDKLEWIIQKAVELGVHEIVLFSAHNSVSRPDVAGVTRKLERYMKIAAAAAEQCGRSKIPKISFEGKLTEAVRKLSGSPLIVALHERETTMSLRRVLQHEHGAAVALIVGPEGGFSGDELCSIAGLVTAGMGPRVLRAESAAIAALSAALYEFGDLG